MLPSDAFAVVCFYVWKNCNMCGILFTFGKLCNQKNLFWTLKLWKAYSFFGGSHCCDCACIMQTVKAIFIQEGQKNSRILNVDYFHFARGMAVKSTAYFLYFSELCSWTRHSKSE